MSEISLALWRDIMAHLRQQHTSLCRQWFEQLQPVEMNAGLLTIQTNNAVQQNYLQKRCVRQFTEAAQLATGALVTVEFVDGVAIPSTNKSNVAPNNQVNASNHHIASQPASISNGQKQIDWLEDQLVLSPDYSFDQFVTGPENELAYSAAVAVANHLGATYNPLFIHGGVGLGKTHLLQAICQTVLSSNPGLPICYLSCGTFVNQFLDSIQLGQMNEFRRHYRQVHLLVIDDIHFLANRERTQEEFFHTFNELKQLNRQIVLSSDSPPSEIPKLAERLVSRFQSGMVATVAKPQFETRVAIVRAKARLRDLELPDDAVSYIATKIDTNARELEGALTTIQGHATIHQKSFDLTLTRQVLGDPTDQDQTRQVTLQQVIDAVTKSYNVRLSDLQSKRRHKSITLPRQVCMWLARRRTRFSLQEIGGYFGGRDHTTVMHAIQTVDRRVKDDTNFAKQANKLDSLLSNNRSTDDPR